MQQIKHAITTIDAQPTAGGGILVFVCGNLAVRHPSSKTVVFFSKLGDWRAHRRAQLSTPDRQLEPASQVQPGVQPHAHPGPAGRLLRVERLVQAQLLLSDCKSFDYPFCRRSSPMWHDRRGLAAL